jgi:D-glycero-D-manno-heptose 1,7-bisphosphate phosphatase
MIEGDWAVFLDRDGVINAPVFNRQTGLFESPYDPNSVELLDGALTAMRRLRDVGALIAVVSNQPGAAKGVCVLSDLEAVHERIVTELADGGVEVDHYGYCFHHPDAIDPALRQRCGCRKPAPGMLIEAASVLGVQVGRCYVVGDSDVDVQAGQAVGCATILIEEPRTAHRRRGLAAQATARNLIDAVRIIVDA